jgi:hypothetical protein
VRLQVWDRLPRAEVDTVGVSLLKAVPEVSSDELYLREQRPDNLLRWDVDVDPGRSGKKALAIQYEFKLELDRQMAIASFQTSGIARAEAPLATGELPMLTVDEAAKVKAALAKLSAEDRQLAAAQVWCAVDQQSPLGINGQVFKSTIKGQAVFFCCKGCQAEAQHHPDQTLAAYHKLMERMKTAAPVSH